MAQSFANAREVEAEHRRLGFDKPFCAMPFSTLLLEPDGQVGACRIKGCEFPVGNIKEQSLEEIWNSPKLRQWRKEFLDGKPSTCQKEVRERACHLCTKYNEILPDMQLEEIQTQGPIRLGLNLNGKCNLECQMCHIWQKPNGLYDEIGFWPQLEKIIPGLKEVELLSGEPFIQKDTYKLIDKISALNPTCGWTITTNAHWKLTDKIKSSLDKIRVRSLIVSIDSVVPETYSKIRKKGDLRVVMETIERLREYDADRVQRGLSSMNMRINFLIQRDNWKELELIHNFERETGFGAFRTFLVEPPEHSILTLEESEREGILDFYLKTMTPKDLKNSMRVLVPILDSLPPLTKGDLWLQLREKTQTVA
ncbi:SPASM domain-containing protein [bacterium]|nr:SPASM domain-containing protein [bacterium]